MGKNLMGMLGLFSLISLAVLCGVVLLAHPANAVVSCTPSAPLPANGTVGVDPTETVELSITVAVNNAPHVTIHWYSSPTGVAGTWTLIGTATNVHNGTHSINATGYTSWNTVCYWRITYTTTAATTGAVYHFETIDHVISAETKSDVIGLIFWGMCIVIIITIFGAVVAKVQRGGDCR
jgi:hypothetical protein